MARYQLRRPSPVKVLPRHVRRQAVSIPLAPAPAQAAPAPAVLAAEAEEVEEVEEGLESPDSPFSSPSTMGGGSESEDSDSDEEEEEEEPASPIESGTPATTTQAPSGISKGGPSQSAVKSLGEKAAAAQITGTATMATATRPTVTTITSRTMGQKQATASSIALIPAPPQSETSGDNEGPHRAIPHSDHSTMSKGAIAAATVLSVLGAVALIVGAIIFFKHRKRKQQSYSQRLPDDAFNPDNTGALRAPETAHLESGPSIFSRVNGGEGNGGGGGSHLTRSTERSNTLFGPAPYIRPETVSTEQNKNARFSISPPQPTPNPFVDPPLNKAYDVLAGRPRSTTLTDRGSWVKNPFRNPESERFDPFGELKEKARAERVRYVEEARREAEVVRGYEEKERMGLKPDGLPTRKGSDADVYR